MIATIKETIKSLQDKTYGREIIKKSLKDVLWYWTKYLLIFSLIPFVMAIASLTYFVPQFPASLKNNLPDIQIEMKDHKFSTSTPDPLKYGDSNFLILIDEAASESALASYSAGLVVSSDRAIFKDGDSTRTETYESFSDFSLTRSQIVDWASTRQLKIWFTLCLAIVVLAVFLLVFYWAFRFAFFWFWAFVFWLISKFFKKNIAYTNVFKLVVYGSVLPLLVSAVLLLAPNDLLSLVNVGVFVFFTVSWIMNLQQ